MKSTTHAAFARLRRLVPTASIAAALGAATFAYPAIASADRVLDLGAFHDCVDQAILDGLAESDAEAYEVVRRCYINNGGDWNPFKQVCEAPPMDAEVQHTPRPHRVGPAEQVPATFEPAPPSVIPTKS